MFATMRVLLPSSLVAVLLGVSCGSAELVAPRKLGLAEKVRSLSACSTIERFKPNEGAKVILSGQSQGTILGLYVFDSQGNCVAKDDDTTPQNGVDLAVEWVPSDASPYAVEIHNVGMNGNIYELAIR